MVMTTWHSNESFEEALWFCLSDAEPYHGYQPTSVIVAVGVGDLVSSNTLSSICDDIEGLNNKIIYT
jgi:hypothetical protein